MNFALKIVRMESWRLFCWIFGIICVTGFTTTEVMFSDDITFFLIFYPIGSILTGLTIGGWWWILGTKLQEKIPETFRMKVTMFKICLLLPFFYVAIVTTFFGRIFSSQMLEGDLEVFNKIIPFHFLSMICSFYALYFVAKSLKIAELQKPVTFESFIPELILIGFPPLGVWFIQPRINQIFEK